METRPVYGDGIRAETLLPFGSGWQQPTAAEVKTVVTKAGLSGDEVAALVGKKGGGRTVRRWWSESPTDFRPLDYAEWAILCYEAGFGLIWQQAHRRKGWL